MFNVCISDSHLDHTSGVNVNHGYIISFVFKVFGAIRHMLSVIETISTIKKSLNKIYIR